MSPITQYANSLADNENELKQALNALQNLVDAIPDADNKPQAASKAWQAWKQLNDTYQLDKTKAYPDVFQWVKLDISNYLENETKNHAFNNNEPDPISLEPINHAIMLRSGHRFNAASLLQHFQAGHRFNPLTQEAISEDEFKELMYQLVSACYSNRINSENSMLFWHSDIGTEMFKQNSLLCVLFTCFIINWMLSGCDMDTPLIPVMLLCVPLMQEIFGHNVFLGLPAVFDNKDNNGKMKLPICLSIFKVANNVSMEPSQSPSPQH